MLSEEKGEFLEWDWPPEDDSVDDNDDLSSGEPGHEEAGGRNPSNPGNTTKEYSLPADLGDDDAWLAAIQYTPGNKSVCFQFANEERCEFMQKTGKYKAAKALGKEAIQTIAKGLRQQGAYDKTHSELPPKATSSQGARSLLKRPSGTERASRPS